MARLRWPWVRRECVKQLRGELFHAKLEIKRLKAMARITREMAESAEGQIPDEEDVRHRWRCESVFGGKTMLSMLKAAGRVEDAKDAQG